ncbi:MAG: UxaA family hydrolase [Spirochaetaceae bacterium]|nr:UxaA family hydrolase [Spirochaetaceae bacterium]
MTPKIIKISSKDNVGIAINTLENGSEFLPSLYTHSLIPQGHKVSLTNLKKGDSIYRYGVEIGKLLVDAPVGTWIDEHMISLPLAPDLDTLEYLSDGQFDFPTPDRLTFEGYKVDGCAYAGTRNILGITSTVQCVSGVLKVAVEKIKRELLPKYPQVNDVVSLEHSYGCGVAINATDADIPIRSIKNLIKNPNFGGEIMVVCLGCEKLTIDMLLSENEINSKNVVILQECSGYEQMIEAVMDMAKRKLEVLNKRKRETLPLSQLCIGLQCGGSDSFSGITANPATGYASDLLVKAGATVLFSEVTEVRDGVDKIAHRCTNSNTIHKLSSEMKWYDDYLSRSNVDRNANPTPGNKTGGLCNIVEKAMGSIAKSGTSPIVEVLSPGEIPTKCGMIFAATPASDFVCGTEQLASGITLQVLMTGRGTPYGLAAAPVIKVCSRKDLFDLWSDLIDVNAGTIATGEKSIEDVGVEIFNLILDVASGKKKSWAEEYKLENSLCIFNPAPIT